MTPGSSETASRIERVRVTSSAPWEATVGYSRAVRTGNFVAVAGTVAANADGTIHAPGDAYAQDDAIKRLASRPYQNQA